MKDKLIQCIKSTKFKERLEKINYNYPNLKQENVIRNSILELLNDDFQLQNPNLKAFAEHPRARNYKVDLSIVEQGKLDDPYLIEFKFQYTNDFKQFLNYKFLIDNDFQRAVINKQTDLFILIVCHLNKIDKAEFDSKWKISSNLIRYISKNEDWKKNVEELFKNYQLDTQQEKHFITISKPYETHYTFFLMSRNAIIKNIGL